VLGSSSPCPGHSGRREAGWSPPPEYKRDDMEVVVKDSFEAALAIFKKGCTPIIKELKDRRGYLRPGERRRLKSMRARRRMEKMEKKMRRLSHV
jgi:ribosomal protein S21